MLNCWLLSPLCSLWRGARRATNKGALPAHSAIFDHRIQKFTTLHYAQTRLYLRIGHHFGPWLS
jgi:hypothetical protein